MAGKRRAAGDPSTPERLRGRMTRNPRSQRPRPSRGRRLRTWALRLGVAFVVLALLGVAGFVWLYKSVDIPEANAEFLTNASIVYYDGGKDELGRYAIQNRDSIPLGEMPDTLKEAVVAAEDQSFYSNNGIDTKGIARALFNNVKGGSTQGASTITQQYVKILYLTQERSYERKVKEAILSLKIQREFSKDEVLAGYLNTIYFGRGAYGVQAAAQAYFRVPVAELDLRQSAVLASVLNDPNDLDPADGREARQALKGRYQYVLDSMAATGKVTDAEAAEAAKRLPKFPKQAAESTYGGQRGHMLTLIKDQVLGLTNADTGERFTEEEVDGGGLRIETTIDKSMMSAMERGVEEIRPTEATDTFTKPQALHVGAATVQPGTGALKAFYGGQDYLKSQLNWAVAGGQAGSTFKPFAVAAALKDGFSLDDRFDGNSPIEIGDTEFENQGDRDYGSAVTLTAATQDSINTAFIDLTDSMSDGPQKIIDTAEAMGIPPEKARPRNTGIPNNTRGLEPNTGVALGSQTVSPVNMATGYATIANEGVFNPVYVIDKVTDRNGTVLYQHKVTEKRALSADIASDVSYAMQQVVSGGSGDLAQLDDGRPTAGKTGTATNDEGDVVSSWFAGFTPQLATAVVYVRGTGVGKLDGWLPYSAEVGRDGYFGGNYPARTFNAIMNGELEGADVEEFPDPAFVDGEAPDTYDPPYVPPPPAQTREPDRDDGPREEPTRKPTKQPTKQPTQEPPAPTTPPPPPSPEPTLPSVPPSPQPSDPNPSPSQGPARTEASGTASGRRG
ncbi:transglycosylase domain-containing protein [Nocardioides litoris]|uniref:transglycosylase domain-containing protein n=1 Tax=Nocardioides litoris TaxID=1926648 RepID=UPI0014769950|nr:transglycosylase domain-containing protein [Nocardioides litoris]